MEEYKSVSEIVATRKAATRRQEQLRQAAQPRQTEDSSERAVREAQAQKLATEERLRQNRLKLEATKVVTACSEQGIKPNARRTRFGFYTGWVLQSSMSRSFGDNIAQFDARPVFVGACYLSTAVVLKSDGTVATGEVIDTYSYSGGRSSSSLEGQKRLTIREAMNSEMVNLANDQQLNEYLGLLATLVIKNNVRLSS